MGFVRNLDLDGLLLQSIFAAKKGALDTVLHWLSRFSILNRRGPFPAFKLTYDICLYMILCELVLCGWISLFALEVPKVCLF